jgi:hypothetical protein
VLLGKTRIEAHARDAARINGDGRLPLIIALAAHNGSTLIDADHHGRAAATSRCDRSPNSIGEAMRTAKQLDEVIALLAALFPKTFAVLRGAPATAQAQDPR